MSLTASIDQRIIAKAGLQHGVISSRQLRELGVDRSAVKRRVASGWLRRLTPRVYSVGTTVVSMGARPTTDDPWLMAAVLHAGAGAVLSHAAAAARLGGWDRWNGNVTVTARHHVRAAPGLAAFRRSASITDDRVGVIRGIPVTSPERTVVDLGTELTAWQICAVVRELRYRDLVDLTKVEDLLERRLGERGTACVRRALILYRSGSAGTRSWTEDHLLEGLLRTSLPVPRINDRGVADVQGIEPDFAWPDIKLIVEVDGHTSHDQPGKREHDRRRDEVLAHHGWLVVRFDARRVRRHRASVVREILAIHEARAASRR